MEVKEFLRVVSLRRGRLTPVEFRLREGEKGLSLFARLERPSPAEVVEAVRVMGKQGDLVAAVISAENIRELGLSIVSTAGGTPNPEVNAVHYEARFRWSRRLILAVRRKRPDEFFNDEITHKLFAVAHILE
jgi:hypothetical protein